MNIRDVSIINYKSCRATHFSAKADECNVFIGLNDAGKSTLLRSIDLAFNKSQCSFNKEGNNKTDLSNSPLTSEEFSEFFINHNLPLLETYDNESIVIIVSLQISEIELEEIFNKELSNHLSWAIENLNDFQLHYCRTISISGTKTYLIQKCTNDLIDIFSQPATYLNQKIRELEISQDDITNSNNAGRFSNLEKIRAILSKSELEPIWIEYKSGKADDDVLPIVEYFDWNTSMDEISSIATSLMKDKINEHLQPIKDAANAAAHEVEVVINDEFSKLQETISSVAPEISAITSRVFFDVKERISDIMVEKIDSDSLIHLENQGDGVKRKIWFSLIKSKASKHDVQDFNRYIWAFDEPETHLHPAAQRDFFDILKKLSLGNVQTFLGTHSTIFIDKASTSSISSVSKDENGYSVLSKCDDVESIYDALGVKNSDFLFYDKFLIVEGDTEQFLIPALYRIYTDRSIIDDNIQIINIGGKDRWRVAKTLLNKIMTDFKKNDSCTILLFDKDMSHSMDAVDITEKVFFVGKQDIEDSISSSVWTQIVNVFYEEHNFAVDEQFIEMVNEKVIEGKDVPSNNKFFKLLESELRKKWLADFNEETPFIKLPSKGKESADFILTSIDSQEKIPKGITDAFDEIQTI